MHNPHKLLGHRNDFQNGGAWSLRLEISSGKKWGASALGSPVSTPLNYIEREL